MRAVVMDTPETVGRLIRRHRETLGITQAELAAAVGISRQALTHYEADERDPTAATLTEIAAAIGCQPGDLFPPTAPRGKRK